ncbi:hypothetical protein GlitD10_2527 [Gloeomargarita lithophora Alchichica-D10]|uniref:HepT-like domain-containing protein n=1 Tax=Gloeomargarita lithophora Alchichica-D10 TaxID=1188229 RepID=A0A1J0AG26_9CYAN|nr:hypothetical protein [Gloeomargarita lithophora]APB34864.1 hypothetical protein GlitD10_2527 [Gloeomargarita lithophora Alchichica-D10]
MGTVTNPLILVRSIAHNLSKLQKTKDSILRQLNKAKITGDEDYWYALSANLVSFYTGCESIFKLVANNIDYHLPKGSDWHIQLLEQISTENSLRPEVISLNTCRILNPYRGFRHLFMNNYAIDLDAEKLESLGDSISIVYDSVNKDILFFIDIYLEQSQAIDNSLEAEEYD